MCFDTTASSTGYKAGACVLIEKKLQKNLLYLACRHYVFELLIVAAFETTLGGSSAPEVKLFKSFKDQWGIIDKNKFQTATSDAAAKDAMAGVRDDILQLALSQLCVHQPRADYREFLELSIIFLDETPTRGITFMTPGAMHQARWMSKVLYSIKIWMFCSQFHLTAREEKELRDIAIFSMRLYLRVWITAPSAIDAPFNDLQLMIDLLQLPQSILPSLLPHQRNCLTTFGIYLRRLIGFALFDTQVFSSTKRQIVEAFNNTKGKYIPMKRPEVNMQSLQSFETRTLVTSSSMNLFHNLQLPTDFLRTDPDTWETQEEFLTAQRRLRSLKVVNDSAERVVALIQAFNKTLTQDEDQLQFVLQVVSEHRRVFPSTNKDGLAAKVPQ